MIDSGSIKPGFHLDFFAFCGSFGFSYQKKAKTSNAMFKWKHIQKNQNEHQKAKTSNQRHLPVSIFL